MGSWSARFIFPSILCRRVDTCSRHYFEGLVSGRILVVVYELAGQCRNAITTYTWCESYELELYIASNTSTACQAFYSVSTHYQRHIQVDARLRMRV